MPVLLIDTYPGALRAARSAGVPTLQAELLSRHAEEGLADQPPDYLLAATGDEHYNALVCTSLALELGRDRVYQLTPSADHLVHAETGLSRDLRGKVVGGAGLDFEIGRAARSRLVLRGRAGRSPTNTGGNMPPGHSVRERRLGVAVGRQRLHHGEDALFPLTGGVDASIAGSWS